MDKKTLDIPYSRRLLFPPVTPLVHEPVRPLPPWQRCPVTFRTMTRNAKEVSRWPGTALCWSREPLSPLFPKKRKNLALLECFFRYH